MNRDDKKCENCGEIKSIDAYAPKWKKGRGTNKFWDPKDEAAGIEPNCVECSVRNTTSKKPIHVRRLIEKVVDLDQKQSQSLYMVSRVGDNITEEMALVNKDFELMLEINERIQARLAKMPDTYDGIGDIHRANSSKKSVSENLGIPLNELKVELVRTSTMGECDLLEKVLLPKAGIGWNFQQGASVGNGIYSESGATQILNKINRNK